MNLARALAEYADELEYGRIDDETVRKAKARLVDSIACSFSSRALDSTQTVLEFAKDKPGTESKMIGGGAAGLENATLANGTLIRGTDWNDSYLSKSTAHPSDNLSAILSVCGSRAVTGQELITTTVLAYEIQCRLSDAASLRRDGFDHVTFGLVSSALATGKLLGLTRSELEDAVNISLSSHLSLRQIRAGEVSKWKGSAFANAARNAVVAVELAQRGITGPAPIFEGKYGFSRQLSDTISVDVSTFGGNEGTYKLKETTIKRYPLFYHGQSAVDCAVEIMEREGLRANDITKIENKTFERAIDVLDSEKWGPETRETADHSMPYCIACAVINGIVTVDHFREEALSDPKISALIDRIEIDEDPAYTAQYGEKFPHFMRIHTEDGIYEQEVEYPNGHPKNPLREEEIEDKFARAVDEYLTPSRRETLLDYLWNVEKKNDMSELINMTNPAAE